VLGWVKVVQASIRFGECTAIIKVDTVVRVVSLMVVQFAKVGTVVVATSITVEVGS